MTTLEVDGFGRVIPESLTRALAAHPNLVSLQYANNEVGVVQNIPALAALCREADVLLHVDAVQAAATWPSRWTASIFCRRRPTSSAGRRASASCMCASLANCAR